MLKHPNRICLVVSLNEGKGCNCQTRRHNIQHNDTQHNAIQHNNTLSLCWMSLWQMSRFIYCYAECCYAKCRVTECHYANCHGTECHYAEYRYAECHYGQCRSTVKQGIYWTSSCFCLSANRRPTQTPSVSVIKQFMGNKLECLLVTKIINLWKLLNCLWAK